MEEEISWVQSTDDHDSRSVMQYTRRKSNPTARNSRISFVDWKAAGGVGLPAGGELITLIYTTSLAQTSSVIEYVIMYIHIAPHGAQ